MDENDAQLNPDSQSLSERALEDYLVQNIRDLDSSLSFEGRQVRIEVGVIDILAKESKGMVIIELKADQADENAVAQIARYLGWMVQQERHAAPFLQRKFRAILVASDFTQGAWCAAETIPYLTLYKFKLSKLVFSEVVII